MNAYLSAYNQFQMSEVYVAVVAVFILCLLFSLVLTGKHWQMARKRLFILLICVPILMLTIHNIVVANFNYNEQVSQSDQIVQRLLVQRFGKRLIAYDDYFSGSSFVTVRVYLAGSPYNISEHVLVNPWFKVVLQKSNVEG